MHTDSGTTWGWVNNDFFLFLGGYKIENRTENIIFKIEMDK